jgi:undecaprenyl-diphosphatase
MVLSLGDALILGVVEGLTEFLPISSTGHLILTQHFMGLPSSGGLDAYLIAVQFGAILAVLVLYWKRLLQMFAGVGDLVCFRSTPARGLDLNLLVAFLPAAIIGLMADGFIEEKLFNPRVVVVSLSVGALIMLFASYGKKQEGQIEGLSAKNALIIGLWQILSLFPGMSRSMTTIVGGMSQKLSAEAAAEFSFLLGAITLGAASLYKVIGCGGEILALGVGPVLVGFVAAFVSAAAGIKILVGALNRWGLAPWTWYRIVLAGVVLWGLGK